MKWTADIAYVVGLLATDGNLSQDGRHIILRSSDVQLLNTFITCLGLTTSPRQSFNNGYAKLPSYRVQFSNATLYRWLIEIGLFPAKTYTLGRIKLNKKYFRDFLRGHLDGDGSISIYEDKYNFYKNRNYTHFRLFLRFISVSKEHLFWLSETISQLAGVHGAIFVRMPKQKNHVPLWTLKFSKKESLLLLNWMYYSPNVPCLLRKYEKAKQALEFCAAEVRKPYTKI